jgi:membrane protease YdiL (CAAX protease family)
VFHVIPLLIPLMIFVGFGLAYIYERRGSLFASIAAHSTFNVIGYTLIVTEWPWSSLT